jgi:uracil-DNA glycosylase
MTNSDMPTPPSDMTPQQASAALAWLIDMGADEVICEAPVNRFLAVAPAPVPVATPAPLLRPAPTPVVRKDIVDGPAPDASACMSIEDIHSALMRLDECPLKRTASNLCFADGNTEAPIMIIGDVPGRDEDIEGKVFAGQNALLLEKMLGAIGLSMDAVSLFNFIPWRPPGNRTVTEAEVQMCQPFMLRAIELCRPKYILSFGVLPMQRLLGRSESLITLRGKLFELSSGDRKIPFMASYHPSYLIQQPTQKRLAWRDLLTFQEAIDG